MVSDIERPRPGWNNFPASGNLPRSVVVNFLIVFLLLKQAAGVKGGGGAPVGEQTDDAHALRQRGDGAEDIAIVLEGAQGRLAIKSLSPIKHVLHDPPRSLAGPGDNF